MELNLKDSTLEETYLDKSLTEIYMMFPSEIRVNLMGVVTSALFKQILVFRQKEVLLKMANILDDNGKPEMDPLKLAEKYKILRVESLFIQDIVTFMDNTTASLKEEYPDLVTRGENQVIISQGEKA